MGGIISMSRKTDIKILIIKTHVFGGANYLLDRFLNWLKKESFQVECRVIADSVMPISKHFELAVLPCYKMDDVYYLRKKGIKIERVLLWDMGMGCFQDGYFNPYNTKGV